MIDIFNTITIGGTEYPRPSNIAYKREDIYAGEYTTCTGARRADYIGSRFSDIELTFDTLPGTLITALSQISGTTTLAFTDQDGTHTLTVMRKGFSDMPTRHTMPDGTALWQNVTVIFSFVDASTTPDGA